MRIWMSSRMTLFIERFKIHRYITASLLITVIMMFAVTPSVFADELIRLTKTADYTSIGPGETVTFDIQYSGSSITQDLENFVITDTLPDTMEYIGYEAGNVAHIASVQEPDAANPNTLIINMIDPFPAGTTGTFKVMARFKQGVTPNGTVGKNEVVGTADGSDDVYASAVVKAKTPETNWNVQKTRTNPAGSVEPMVGSPVTYTIVVNGNSSDGLDIHDVRLVDTLPEDISDVSSPDGDFAGYDALTNTATWLIGDLPAGTRVTRSITYTYGSSYDLLSTVTNIADAYGKEYGSTEEITEHAEEAHGFDVETQQIDSDFYKNNYDSNTVSGDLEKAHYSVGQTAIFEIGGFNNAGNVALSNLIVEDGIPIELNLLSITTAKINRDEDVHVYYKTNLDTNWISWGTYSSLSTQSLLVSGLGLSSGEYVTNVRFHYDNAPVGFEVEEPIFIRAEVLNFDRNGAMVTDATNEATFTADDQPVIIDDAQITVGGQKAWYYAEKTADKETVKYFQENDSPDKSRVTYTLKVGNHEYATGYMNNPIAIDILPISINPDDASDYAEVFEAVDESSRVWDWSVGNTGLDKNTIEPVFSQRIVEIDGKDRTVLMWEFDDDSVVLGPGEYVEITFPVTVERLTRTDTYTNELYMTSNDEANDELDEMTDFDELVDDIYDLDNDGNTDDKIVKSSADVFVLFQGSMESSKWVHGYLDVDAGGNDLWTKYPEYGKTQVGAEVRYQLKIVTKEANGPIKNLVIIDVFPHIGDTGLIDTSARESKWEPHLSDILTGKNGIALPSEAVVYYSIADSLSLDELSDPKNSDGADGDLWSITPPYDLTEVTAVKIDFNEYVFEPGEEMIVEIPMIAPVDAPVNLDGQTLAWNSFAYTATYPGFLDGAEIDKPFAAAEPIKVGVEIEEDLRINIGNFVWQDANANGIQDANDGVHEEGINGVFVNLYESVQTPGVDEPIRETITGDSHAGAPGYYMFNDLPVGDYIVEFVYPDYYELSEQNALGSTADNDSNNCTEPVWVNKDGLDYFSIYTEDIISITSGEDLSIDLGLYETVELGDYVWNDKDGDGNQDSNEQGFQGITVTLTDEYDNQVYHDGDTPGVDAPVQPQTTDEYGRYLFRNLTPGRYKVTFSGLPYDYRFSDALQGSYRYDSDVTNIFTAPDSTYYGSPDIVTLLSPGLEDTPLDKNVGSSDNFYEDTDETTDGDYSIDAGIHTAMLGDTVWIDWERDGVQDDSTNRYYADGVTVQLRDAAGNPVVDVHGNEVSEQITDENGKYLFSGLIEGDYIVRVILPSDFEFVSGDVGGNTGSSDAVDSDITENIHEKTITDLGYGDTNIITLSRAERDMTIDAGLQYLPSSLGDYVWHDTNGDGIQDATEHGLQGIQVELFNLDGDFHRTVYTDADGLYYFGDLNPDTYYVKFTDNIAGTEYIFSQSGQGSDDAKDSNANADKTSADYGKTENIVLPPDTDIDTIDAGMFIPADIGDYVWVETDNNGLQDSGENGINGVTVLLLDNNGVELERTTTADDEHGNAGYYEFTDLPQGDYYVEFVEPSGYIFVVKDQGADDTVDSDADFDTGRSHLIELSEGESEDTIDAGLIRAAALGDRVWIDLDRDGLRNGTYNVDYANIRGVTVNLYKASDTTTVIKTMTTPNNGRYAFTNLYPGDYIVEFVLPTSGEFLNQLEFTDIFTTVLPKINSDSNADDTTGRTDTITLIAGETNNTIDAGLEYIPSSLGDYVWHDENFDGIQDATEVGINGVKINLYNGNGDLLKSYITETHNGTDGYYYFDELNAGRFGDYTVEIDASSLYPNEVNGTKYLITQMNQQSDDDVDSDFEHDRTSADYAEYSLNIPQADTHITNIDAGLFRPARLGDRVWIDANLDGIQDAGEAGLNGVTVNLYNSTGTTLLDTTTTATVSGVDGVYLFEDVEPGHYMVEFDLSGMSDDYIFVSQNVGADDTVDSDVNIYTGRTTDTITLNEFESDITIDAGVIQAASIGDYVWLDLDRNGINDGTEGDDYEDFGNIVVRLLKENGDPATDINDNVIPTEATNANGEYLFDDLYPGRYIVEFVLPDDTEYQFVDKNATGSTVNNDSDANASGTEIGRSDNIDLSIGEDIDNIDAGIEYIPSSIGDYIWHDSDYDGVQDSDELGVNGIVINLFDGNGTFIRSTTTITHSGKDGYYLFDELNAGTHGDYIVEIDASSLYPNTVSGVQYKVTNQNTTADDEDSDAVADTTDANYGRIADTNIATAGTHISTFDAGLYITAGLGNYVWIDDDVDGYQDAIENGLVGVTVNLYDAAGITLLDSTATAADGSYTFEGLPPLDYIVEFDISGMSDDYLFVAADNNADDTKDSDANTDTGRAPLVELSQGEYDDTIDAGVIQAASIGDYVWLDLDRDGINDGADGVDYQDFENVTVRLLDETGSQATDVNGDLISNETTDTNGEYLFDNLYPGRYIVEFVLTDDTKYQFVDKNATGATVDNDSDAQAGGTAIGQSDIVNLSAGQEIVNIDAGMEYIPSSIGDYVWHDKNYDGIQDAGEVGINGITVNLLDSSGTFIRSTTTTTNAGTDGYYLFDELNIGDYIVEIDNSSLYPNTVGIAKYKITKQNQGSDDEDSDVDTSTRRTGVVEITSAGTNIDNVDAGLYGIASLGDRVWEDVNNNGIQDTGETGVNGVTVNLYDSTGNTLLDTTTTANVSGEDGMYLFDELDPRNYIVEFVISGLSDDYIYVDADQGTEDDKDSDAVVTSDITIARTTVINVEGDEHDMTIDAGIVKSGSIGDYVWLDLDRDGSQDGTSSDLENVTVNLLDENGVQIDTMTTDASGKYLFTNLYPGDYYVEFVNPDDTIYQFIDKNATGATVDNDSDAQASGVNIGRSDIINLAENQNITNIDAGFEYIPSSIGDYIWHDINYNGIQDTDELGINDVTINLLDGSGVFIRSTTTSAYNGKDGYYLFDDLNSRVNCDYIVEIDTNSLYPNYVDGRQYKVTLRDVGADDLDSDADDVSTSATYGRIADVSLTTPDTHRRDLDGGLHLVASLGDYVWIDTDADGVQDVDESGVDGVGVNLIDAGTNAQLDTTTTSGGGQYLFTGLAPGDYIIEFDYSTLSGDYYFVNQDAGGDDSKDSDADTTTGKTAVITLKDNESNLTIDAGIVRHASLGDRVWFEEDRDGLQDANSVDFDGVTVNLLDYTQTQIATTTTDANGNYVFEHLMPGEEYYVEFELPANYEFTAQYQGSDIAIDSDADTTNGLSDVIVLKSGEFNQDIDAGLKYLSASLGDYVWRDSNLDGQQDADEAGVSGIVVNLLDGADNLLSSTITDANGYYLFEDLNPGDYKIEVVAGTEYEITQKDAVGDDVDSDIDTTTGITDTITLALDEDNMDIDAGLYVLASLGDVVWEDMNRDGIQDSGERYLSGIDITLLDSNSIPVASTTTNAAGQYLFDRLQPGRYYVKFTQPADSKFSPRYQGANNEVDSNVNITTGITDEITLGDGEHNGTIDAGIIPLLSLGDKLWVDKNANGIQDGADYGMNGITLKLYNARTGMLMGTQVTRTGPSGDGYYLFEKLEPDLYYIESQLPPQFSVTYIDAGDDTIDNDGFKYSSTIMRTEVFDLNSNILIVDLGLIDLNDYPYWDGKPDDDIIMENPKTGEENSISDNWNRAKYILLATLCSLTILGFAVALVKRVYVNS